MIKADASAPCSNVACLETVYCAFKQPLEESPFNPSAVKKRIGDFKFLEPTNNAIQNPISLNKSEPPNGIFNFNGTFI